MRSERLATIPEGHPDVVAANLTTDPRVRRVAYRSQRQGKWRLVVGESAGPEFDHVHPALFDVTGSRFAYKAQRGRARFLVVGDEVGRSHDDVGAPVFSPDGSRLAYAAVAGRS